MRLRFCMQGNEITRHVRCRVHRKGRKRFASRTRYCSFCVCRGCGTACKAMALRKHIRCRVHRKGRTWLPPRSAIFDLACDATAVLHARLREYAFPFSVMSTGRARHVSHPGPAIVCDAAVVMHARQWHYVSSSQEGQNMVPIPEWLLSPVHAVRLHYCMQCDEVRGCE